MTTLRHEICEDRPAELRDDTIYLITGARETRDHDIFYAAIPCQCKTKSAEHDSHFNIYTYGLEPDGHGRVRELYLNDDETVSIKGYINGKDRRSITAGECNCSFWIDHNRVVNLRQCIPHGS